MRHRARLEDALVPGGGFNLYQRLVTTPRGRFAGRVIGRYRLEELRATGGMGEVYVARRIDGRFERQVAVKVSTANRLDGEMRQRFMLEQALLAEFNHPNVAHLYDAGITDEGAPYIVMELVEGEPIDEYCRARRLDPKGVTAMIREVCQAVAYSHARMIVHRDIKPSNILVPPSGRPKLVDFGIAKYLRSHPAETLGHTPLTPRYASPEQLRGDSITVASDVYQIGLVMFELLCGQPFRRDGGIHTSIRHAIEGAPGNFDPLVQSDTPKDLIRIIEQALRNDPVDRYQSVHALRDDLQNYLTGYPVTAAGNAPLYRLKKLIGRNLPLTAVTASATLLLCVSTIWYFSNVMHARNLAEEQAQWAQLEADAARRSERERAATVNLFREVFTSFKADSRPLSEITAEELLTAGAEETLSSLPDEPVVRARALREFARIYVVLDQDARALRMLERVDRSELDGQTLLLDDVDSVLATVHSRAGRYEQSAAIHEQRWQRLHAAANANPAAFDSRRLNVAVGIANDLRGAGRIDETEAWLLRALKLETALEENPREHVLSLRSLGILRDEQGRYDDAAAAYGRAVAVSERQLGEEHALTGAVYQAMGVHLEWQSRFLEARDYYEKALRVIGSIYGRSSRRYGDYLSGVATIEQRLGNSQRAVELLSEAIEILEAAQGARNHLLAQPLNKLATLYRDAGELPEARRLYQRAIDILLDLNEQTGHPHRLIDAYLGLASTERQAGNLDTARAAASEASALATLALPEGSTRFAAIHAELAIQAWQRGDRESAESLWQRLDDLAVRHLDKEDFVLRNALETYFRFLRDAQRPQELNRIVRHGPAYASLIQAMD